MSNSLSLPLLPRRFVAEDATTANRTGAELDLPGSRICIDDLSQLDHRVFRRRYRGFPVLVQLATQLNILELGALHEFSGALIG